MNSILTILLTIWIIFLLADINDKNIEINKKQHTIDSLNYQLKFKDKIIKDYQSRL
jgi:hypothetical protein